MIDQEQDGFMRMAITALSASFHGVHKAIAKETAIKRGQDIAGQLWDALAPMKPQQTAEQWASLKVDAVAYCANMMAHNHDLFDNQLISDALECAKLKWQMHQAWRNKQ